MKSKLILYSVFFFGIVSRLMQYVHNRSLWFDEAALALKIIDNSFWGWLNPVNLVNELYMVKFQAAPLGFLVLIKMLTQFLGTHEFILRLMPQAFSIAAIFLFYRLARKCFKDIWVVLFSLSIFALSDQLIYYSAEFKE